MEQVAFSVDLSKAVRDDQNIDIVYAGVIRSLSDGNEGIEASQVRSPECLNRVVLA